MFMKDEQMCGVDLFKFEFVALSKKICICGNFRAKNFGLLKDTSDTYLCTFIPFRPEGF